MEELLEQLIAECASYTKEGALANYIPELTKADPNKLGAYIISSDGKHYYSGDYMHPFTIQSIVKTILLLQALLDNGMESVSAKVGVEATGKPFDAINVSGQKLDSKNLNPMVNMGAILMCSLIQGDTYAEKFNRILELTRKLSGNPDISIDENVYLSEKKWGNKNRALAYLLKSNGMLDDDVEDVLDCYFKACSILVNCQDLARIASVFAQHGWCSVSETQLFSPNYARYINATLVTSGMYDGSGEFALHVGFPAKSGVGGGIMGVIPHKMGIGVFSPALDKRGNSIAGVKVLAQMSQELDLSIF